MSNPWGGTVIGSWAAEAERAEAEENESLPTTTTTNPQSFPSLSEAITTKPKKKKMTLSEFNSYSGSARLTPDEMLQLPTAPKPRSSNDDFYSSGGPRLGGGFPPRRGFDDDRRGPPRRGPDFDVQPSRADEVDNWASAKRAVVGPNSSSSRYGALGSGSRADEVDNWNVGKKQAPPPVGRSGGFGFGVRDSGSGSGSGSEWRGERERERVVLDPPRVRANPFGVARPREQVLADKGLDWRKLEMEIEAKKTSSSGSRPTSSQGSRPTSSQSNRSENVGPGVGVDVGVKPKPKVNPFGDAKPREVLLQQKGLDWRKIDLELEHRRIERPETVEEKTLKEEIDNLRKELEKESGNDVTQGSVGEQTNLCDVIQMKEKELEALITELNGKARFGQKAVERPGSGAGRHTAFTERPPSEAGSLDGSRGVDSMDRPRSRGTGDVWTRLGEDRRGGFQGGRDRGFLTDRDFSRSGSRNRW